MAQSGNNANSQLNDYELKSRRLLIPFSITHNATPANKTSTSDLPSVVSLALQGQTAATAALDPNTNFGTPTDSTGVFGVLLYGLGGRDSGVQKLLRASVDFKTGASGYTVAANGANSTGVTISTTIPGQPYPPQAPLTEGENIAFTCTSGVNLSTTDLSAVISVDYILVQ